MLKKSVAALTVLLITTSAHAELPPAPAPVIAPPPVVASEATPAPPVNTARVPPVFMDQFLSYDEDADVAVRGRARQRLAPADLYAALDRPDLVEKSRAAVRRRVILAIAGGLLLTAGVATAVVAQTGMPDLNRGYCVATRAMFNYNSVCVPNEQLRTTLSAVGLVGGISLGGLLGALAYWSGPDVLSKDAASELISQHNGALLKRLRSSRGEVRVAPYASVQGGGVMTTLTF